MKILEVRKAQLDYVATLTEPAFSLWSDIPGIIGGLYSAFTGLHTGLADFGVEGDERDPLARVIVATLGNQFFRVGYDRVEAVLPAYDEENLMSFSETLSRGDWWLRTYWPDVEIGAHYLTFSIHAAIQEGSSVAYLRGLQSRELTGIGNSLGTGLIFHVAVPNTPTQVHLTIDHSTELEDGLFVQYVVTVATDQLAHAGALEWSTSTLHRALDEVGLMFPGVG